MFSPLQIAFACGLPVALLLGWFWLVRRGPGKTWSAPLVVFSLLAVLGASIAVSTFAWGQSKLVPTGRVEWLGWFALAWGFVAAVEAAAIRGEVARHLLRVAVLAVGFAQLFGKRLDDLSPSSSGYWLAFAIATGTALACELVSRAFARVPSPIAECAPMAAFAGAAALSLFAGYATLAQSSGVAALLVAIFVVGSLLFRSEPSLRTGLAVFAFGLLVAIALCAALFGAPKYEPSLWALVALGFLAPSVVATRPFERLGAFPRFLIAALLALAPIAAAAWLAFGTYAPNPYG
ncbi:MAG: hypothetical protein K8S98_12825 [Planctomycetes bacterium]|nr:hypothetical protein [Planctomycetota bacterium]